MAFSYKDCIYRPVGSPFLCYKRMLDTIATSCMLWEDQVKNVGDLCSHTVGLLSAPTHTSPSWPLVFGWPPATYCWLGLLLPLHHHIVTAL